MGTDIHAFIEIDYSTDGDPFALADNIRALNTGELFIWRNYDLFDALGDGRSGNIPAELGGPRQRALFPPRGLPAVVSHAVFQRYYELVLDEGQDFFLKQDGLTEPPVKLISRARADESLAAGLAHLSPLPEWRRTHDGREVRVTWISNANWHHASWLTLRELHAALEHFPLRVSELEIDVQVVLEAMARFEQKLGEGRTRLVFWFDC